jgi:hypothetical protein
MAAKTRTDQGSSVARLSPPVTFQLVELHYKLGLAYLRSGHKELGQKELAENRRMHEGGDNSPVSSTKEGSIIVAAIRNKAMRPCGAA